MLKAYMIDSYYKVDDEEWTECGRRGYGIFDDEEPRPQEVHHEVSWDEAYARSYDGMLCSETFFRHRQYIELWHQWQDENLRRFYRGGFEKFSYKFVYTEWKGCTLEWIMKHASADQIIQYMKERGMTACPMQ